MSSRLLDSKRYIETGCIYIQQGNCNAYFINCILCSIEFDNWQYFTKHLVVNHKEDFEQYAQIEEDTHTDCCQSLDEKVELEELINNDDFSEDKQCLAQNQPSTSTAEACYSDHEYIDEELLEIKEEVEVEMLYMQSLNDTNNYTEEEEMFSPAEAENDTEMSRSSGTESAVPMAANDDNDNSDGSPKAEKGTNRPFYNFLHTAPVIMQHFIELIRQNECQYQRDHPDYSDKEVRNENARKIGKALNKTWPQLPTISAGSARQSILQLRRWFELEYVRHMKDSKYISKHQDYYQHLLDFMPYQHLRSLVCDECDRRFRTESCLLQHKHRVHNGPLPFECKYCERYFAHKSTLLTHENRHTMQNSWLCQQCGYSTATKSDFRQHLATHSDQRPFVCNVCGNSYKQSTSLAVHLRTHQPPTLQCQYCQKMFYENYRLKQHINLKHPNGQVIRHKCNVCECEFNSANGLQAHAKIHKKVLKRKRSDFVEKSGYDEELEASLTNCVKVRFDCRFCGDNFSNESNLLEHSLALHGK